MDSLPLPPSELQLLVAGAAFVLSVALSVLMIRINIADDPNERSAHREPRPRAGGVAIAVPFVVLLAAVLAGGYFATPSGANLAAFAAIAAAMALYGLVDDLYALSAPLKLAVQTAAAVLFIAAVGVVERLFIPQLGMIEFGWAGYPLTVLWIVGFMNVFNCLDGIDGMAGGGALIAVAFLGLISYSTGAALVLFLCILLWPAILGFLLFNFPRARIFMGDSGSQFLGFVLAGLAVIGASLDAGRISFYVLPIIFYTFMFDFAATLAVRIMRRRSVMQAHREFMFQVWHRAGWPAPRICLVYFGFLVLNGIVAMIAQWGDDPWLRLYAVLALAVPHLLLALAVYRVGRQAGLFAARGR